MTYRYAALARPVEKMLKSKMRSLAYLNSSQGGGRWII